MTKLEKLRIRWAISRMGRIVKIWEWGLDTVDKAYLLRRIRDKEPALFYAIAQERAR